VGVFLTEKFSFPGSAERLKRGVSEIRSIEMRGGGERGKEKMVAEHFIEIRLYFQATYTC
jgi:hypothetical protein